MWSCWRHWTMYTEVPSIIVKWNLSSSLLSVDHECCRQLRFNTVVSCRVVNHHVCGFRSPIDLIQYWNLKFDNHHDVKSHLISSLQSWMLSTTSIRWCRVVNHHVCGFWSPIDLNQWVLEFEVRSIIVMWNLISSLRHESCRVVSWIITFVCCVWSPIDLNQWVLEFDKISWLSFHRLVFVFGARKRGREEVLYTSSTLPLNHPTLKPCNNMQSRGKYHLHIKIYTTSWFVAFCGSMYHISMIFF